MSSFLKSVQFTKNLALFLRGFGWTIVVVGLASGVCYFLHCFTLYYYHGSAKVTIRFVVTDKESGELIFDSSINHFEMGESEIKSNILPNANEAVIQTEQAVAGDASIFYRDQSLYPLYYEFEASAPGYKTSERVTFEDNYEKLVYRNSEYFLTIEFQLSRMDKKR